ncbi:MAG TPA: TetR/AcrR family transcriptional regulator [Longimicrobium sp.]|nr:TetR/AcrR family transcriptional regulator [Longimicrobium sp.]
MTDMKHQSKTKLLDAAMHVIRARGYNATRIEDVCEAAGLTKGSFFHHFKGKEDLALATARHWDELTGDVFATAPYRALADPLDRLLGYVDFRKMILQGDVPDYTCLVGTMVQEVHGTHPRIREACDHSISDHVATVEADIAEAMSKYPIHAGWSAGSLALHIHAVIQGAFILAKARQSTDVAAASLDHLRRYLEMLFTPATENAR